MVGIFSIALRYNKGKGLCWHSQEALRVWVVRAATQILQVIK